jgi:transcriptional regulator with XRE-family HTH domain
MENGEYKVGLDVLFRILQVFELPLSRFFEELPSEPEVIPPQRPDDDERILDDLRQLSDDSRREVREFIAFKRMQAAQRERRLDTVESSRLSREHEDE